MPEDRAAIERRGERTPAQPDWLVRQGGWILVLVAVALIALATVFADKEAVAAIFALGGVALFIVGVLLPRIQGPLKFGPTGLEISLAELGAELGERTRGLNDEVKAE